MTTQFSDFLAAHAARIADLWDREAQSIVAAAQPEASHGPRQFINTVLVALSADDLRPLVAFYKLDPGGAGLDQRLDTALRHLHALRRATDMAAQEEGLDASAAQSLTAAAADELAGVERRLAAGCVAALEAQLTHATSTSSVRGTSLSITMHELRRPLTILNSYGQLLSTGMLGALPESAMVAIEGITASTEMMVRMVNALAELARLEDPDDHMSIEVMEAAEVVNAAVEHVSMEAKLRGAAIECAVDEGIRVNGDRRRLTLALTNLLGNAVKHTPPESAIEVTVVRDGDDAHFKVRDHGAGFPPEDAAHLFDKYFRSVTERKRKVPGSGLGLYIVRTVVERHQGRVAARTIPDNGAEFEMIIPVHEPQR
jgi:signal transduction histidine kinase